jgi:hypothetical protein
MIIEEQKSNIIINSENDEAIQTLREREDSENTD